MISFKFYFFWFFYFLYDDKRQIFSEGGSEKYITS